MKGKLLLGLICAAVLALAGHARAGTVGWVNWTSATASSGTTPGSASGTMTFGSTTGIRRNSDALKRFGEVFIRVAGIEHALQLTLKIIH